jgi:hypothetical protein
MSEQPPRKKWSERQYELFLETASELGPNVSKEAFDRILERLVSARPAKSGVAGSSARGRRGR